MNDLIAGIGIALVIEGLLWGLAPDVGRRMVADMASLPERQIRGIAWVVVTVGCALVWLVRG